MTRYICINCNSKRDVVRTGDNFKCDRCKFEWDVAHEQACAIYLRGQGREPATSVLAEAEVIQSEGGTPTLTEATGEGGLPVVTAGESSVPPVEQQASGEAEKLPDVPVVPEKPSGKGKANS